MIRGVLFDMGGTLVHGSDPAEVIQSLLDERGIAKRPDEIARAISSADSSFPVEYYVGPGFWREWNRRVLTYAGILSGLEDLAIFVDANWFRKAEIRAYPEAEGILAELDATDLKLGALTNGLSADIPYLLDRPGLGKYLDVKVSADMAGRRKPNPRIFLHAASKLGLPPSDILYVGDDQNLDYHPSESVGMKPVLVNRGKNRVLVKNVVEDLRGTLSYLRR